MPRNFGQLHPGLPSGATLSPHVKHSGPLKDGSELVLGLLSLGLPVELLVLLLLRGVVLMLLLTALDLSEAVLLVLLSSLGGFPGILSRPIGLN